VRTILGAAVFLGVLSGAAVAQTPPETPLAPVFACADIASDQERLACYDRAVGEVRQATSAGRIVAVDREQAETLRRESFGLMLPSVFSLFSRPDGEEDSLDSNTYSVAQILAHVDGRHTFVMGNGQRWTQVEPERSRNIRTGDDVTVRRAAAGSFMMIGTRGGSAHRVRRVN